MTNKSNNIFLEGNNYYKFQKTNKIFNNPIKTPKNYKFFPIPISSPFLLSKAFLTAF